MYGYSPNGTPILPQRRKPTGIAIPEIAAAFQGDPRNRLSQVALNAASSNAPVYGMADGIARVLQGALGGYMQRKAYNDYRDKDQEALLDDRQARGAEGLAGVAQPAAQMMPPIAPQAPVSAASPPAGFAPAIASALGVPAPQALIPQGGQPGGAVPFTDGPSRAVQPASRPRPATSSLADPLGGLGKLTSAYGMRKGEMHNGRDLAAPVGTPVMATAGGVVRAYANARGGNQILIRHDDGSVTGYAHLSAFNVRNGDRVEPGQVVGAVGSTGRSTGPHLHHTFRDASGKRVDPASLTYGQVERSAPEQDSGYTEPQNVAVPPLPEVSARPIMPESEAAAKSRMLEAAYRMMATGNAYESANAQELYGKGLAEQGQMDENAASRKQRLIDAGYSADLQDYTSSRGDARQYGYTSARDATLQNYGVENQARTQDFQRGERIGNQDFQATEGAKERSFKAQENAEDRSLQSQNLQLQIQGRIDAAQQAAANRRNNFFNTAAGEKRIRDTEATASQAEETVSLLDAFSARLDSTKTGGFATYVTPGFTAWNNSDLQNLTSIAGKLALNARQNMPGALSDADREFLVGLVPSISKTKRANRDVIARMRGIAVRQSDYAIASLEARSQDIPMHSFLREWRQYAREVPAANSEKQSFDQWRARPRFDNKGNRIN